MAYMYLHHTVLRVEGICIHLFQFEFPLWRVMGKLIRVGSQTNAQGQLQLQGRRPRENCNPHTWMTWLIYLPGEFLVYINSELKHFLSFEMWSDWHADILWYLSSKKYMFNNFIFNDSKFYWWIMEIKKKLI